MTATVFTPPAHALKREYPVARGLTVGHEPVGAIHKLGSEVQGYREGLRVIAGAITRVGCSNACQRGCGSQPRWSERRRRLVSVKLAITP